MRSSRALERAWMVRTPIAEFIIARIEMQGGGPPSMAGCLAVLYREGEDPGPCRVALSYLYSLEERLSGSPRVRNHALHVKMISLGAKQISEIAQAGMEEMRIAYLICPSEEDIGGYEELECRPEELEEVSEARAARMR